MKVLILMIAGGGGHLAPAKAIREALLELYPGEVEVSIVDISKASRIPLVHHMDDVYDWLVKDGMWLWKALWVSDGKPWLPDVGSKILTPIFFDMIKNIYQNEQPDIVVSVHSFANHMPVRVLRRIMPGVPFVTVVTDLVTVHPNWCCPEVDLCIVPMGEARERAIELEMPPTRVEVIGLPIRLRFSRDLGDPWTLRKEFGLEPERPCVLVIGGGDGMGPIYETSRALAQGLPDAQLAIVTGRNTSLKAKLDAITWEIPTRIFGFIDYIPELMRACNILVTKAGANTLAEAFIARLPVIVFEKIPGQEDGNVTCIQDHEAGIYAPSPEETVHAVQEWLSGNAEGLARAVDNASSLARPHASLDIAARLHTLMVDGR